MKKKWFTIYSGLLLILLFSTSSVFGQSDWKVTDAQAKIKNPVVADEASIKAGAALFQINCKSCHGDPGKGNGLPLVPKPTDMSNADFLSRNSDGAIFTKITEGRVAMPTFKAVLNETQRWQIVNYIRSFDGNKKVAAVPAPVKVKKGEQLNAPYQISLNYSVEDNSLHAFVEGTNAQGAFVPAPDVEVGFFIKRYFGKLPFGDKGVLTDDKGMVQAKIPADIPGGEEGKAIALVSLSDKDIFGDVSEETEVNVKPVEIVNLLDKRSLWTVRVMAPWWLIITYFGILIGVWGTLAYVVFQLFKLKKAGA
ncbi:MAG: cytochrome c [Bacteroidales bacterium]|nr:cytochrome c [Bacteroidales bacterium]